MPLLTIPPFGEAVALVLERDLAPQPMCQVLTGCFVCAALVRNTLTQAPIKASWACFQKLSYFCLFRLLHQAALQSLHQVGFQADRSTWNNLFQLAFYLLMVPVLHPTPAGCRGVTQLPCTDCGEHCCTTLWAKVGNRE